MLNPQSGTVVRHLQRDAALRKQFLDTFKVLPQFTSTGIYAGHAPTAKVDMNRWQGVVGKIVRGLYYGNRKYPVPREYAVQVWPDESFWQDVNARSIIEELPTRFASFGNAKIGFDDVFMGKAAGIADEGRCHIYLLVFYAAVSIFAYVVPLEIAKNPYPSHPDYVTAEIERRRAAAALKKSRRQR